MKLSELHTGERGVIVKVSGHGGFRKRIVEMGFIKGKTVRVILNAPLRDPIEYELMGYKITLRREEARLVEIISESEAREIELSQPAKDLKALVPSERDKQEIENSLEVRMKNMAAQKGRVINVALVGNPNCGKTSLFNIASGSHEHVGNYSGVTVDAKEGFFTFKYQPEKDSNVSNYKEYSFRIIDLPGTYSLSSYSPEERFVRHTLINDTPDVVINVTDATNLERNLYLTTQLIDMNLCMVMALNMYDELQNRKDQLDHKTLGQLLGIPIIPTVCRTGNGIDELFETIVKVYESNDPNLARHIHVNHGPELEESIDRIKIAFQKNQHIRYKYSTRYLAVKFLEKDSEVEDIVEGLPNHDELIAIRYAEQNRIQKELHDNTEAAIIDAKYGFIQGALKETYQPQERRQKKQRVTEKIDTIVTHKWLGFPLFFLLLFLMFEGTFFLGEYPMQGIEWLIEQFGNFVAASMANGPLKDLVVSGIIGGVGSVIVFLPNILILYLFISLLEDSGYMARTAFIMDKVMHRMGLHGKSFIPMIMGFGCNVPAVMATRTIENHKSRLITMLVLPFMSCSARLPIYIILVGAFFPKHESLVMLGLYAFGIITAVMTARILSKFIMKGKDLPFVMELPPYRLPNVKSVIRHTWEKGKQYLQKMAGIILAFSIVIWFLGYYPQSNKEGNIQTEPTELQNSHSYLEQIGQAISPIMSPLGFDWKMSVGIITGIGAKELVVSTLGVMYTEDADTDTEIEETRLQNALQKAMTPQTAMAYMVFILLYFPCIATIIAIKNESGKWKWALFSAIYTTLIAYFFSFIVYRIGLIWA